MEYIIKLDNVEVHRTSNIAVSMHNYQRYVNDYGIDRITLDTEGISDNDIKTIKLILKIEED